MSRIARKTKSWIETLVSLILAIVILVLVSAGAWYVLVIVGGA